MATIAASVFTELQKCENEGLVLESNFALALCEVINSPHALAISLAIRYDHNLLKELKLDSAAYCDGLLDNLNLPHIFPGPDRFRGDRLLTRMLVKSSSLHTGIDVDTVALQTFTEIERVNLTRKHVPLWAPWMRQLRRQVSFILYGEDEDKNVGDPEVLEKILNFGGFSPGGSAGLKSAASILFNKLRFFSTISPELRPFADVIKGDNWCAENPVVEVIPSVTIQCVPKNAFTSRTIASMPSLNMFLQLGLGRYLEERLRVNGCDIRDQSRNQNLASRAYDLGLATIDLESASSWFTERNLEEILPVDLMHLVDLLRPHRYRFDKESAEVGREFLNWAPMGTGYTFTLMSMYFLALVRTVVPVSSWDLCGVYGDDLILPSKYAQCLIDRLEFLGFKVNTSKSYLSGAFFESCGREFFCGHDVTPFYIRRGGVGSSGDSQSPIEYRVLLANKLWRWCIIPISGLCDRRFRYIWTSLIKKVPPQYKNPVPYELGDVGLFSSLDETTLRRSKKYTGFGWEDIYDVAVWKVKPVEQTSEDSFPCLAALCKPYDPGVVFTSTPEKFGPKWKPRSAVFSRGSEPVKGLFGLPVLKRTIARFPFGLSWA
jgi:hypothetical protein